MRISKNNNLKDILEEQGRKQTWLLQKLEGEGVYLNISTISRYCSNEIQPSASTLKIISVFLGVTMEELIA